MQGAKTKEYVRPMPLTWWLQKPAYAKYMLRDFTSVFIAGYCIFLMFLMCRARHEPNVFQAFYDNLRSPLSLVFHGIALLFALIHSITFFNLTPRVIVVFRGDEKVSDAAIAGGHYFLWLVCSAVLIGLVLWLV